MRSPRSRRSVVEPETLSPMMEDILEKVENLSDLDLRRELSTRNFGCGPIVGTTRAVYKKKLVDFICEEELPAEERRARAPSTEDDDTEEDEPRVVNGATEVAAVHVDTVTVADDVNEEDFEEDFEEENEGGEDIEEIPNSSQEDSSLEEDEDSESQIHSQEEEEKSKNISSIEQAEVLRHRTPRLSDGFETKQTKVAFVSEDGKTVKRTTTTTTTTRVMKKSDLPADGVAASGATSGATPLSHLSHEENKKPKKKSSCLSLLFQLIVIAIIVIFVYIIVSGPSSPLALPPQHDVENPPMKDDDV